MWQMVEVMRIRLPWSKETVTCAECGYLCHREYETIFLGERHLGSTAWPEHTLVEKIREVPPKVRSGEEGHNWAWMSDLSCFKHAADLYAEMEAAAPREQDEDSKQERIDYYAGFRAALTKERDCRFFYRYQPGYDAPLHRDLEDQGRRETASRVWNGVFLLLGSGVTLLVTVIVLLLT